MYFLAPNNLVKGGRPVFLGWLEKFENYSRMTLTVNDIDTITFSLFRKNTDTLGEYSRFIGNAPVEDWQNVPVDKNETITSPTQYEKELFNVLGLTPFQTNFIYSPPINPVLFAKAGVYIARFEILDKSGEIHPAEIEMTVR